MRRLLRYFGTLSAGRVILWCYAIWWMVNVVLHFDPRPSLWLTSIGLSVIIGFALCISTRSASHGMIELDRWQTFRLFLMPFCVSSFAALVKDVGYILIFPPTLPENVLAVGCVLAFLMVIAGLRRIIRPAVESI